MPDTSHELTLFAPAKINLGLEVIRRREDGFHDINTVFLALGLADVIRLEKRPDDVISLEIDGDWPLVPDATNLCVRAAELLREHLEAPRPGLHIALTKRIPMGAGLGGGSSDAAAVLLGAARLLGLHATPELALRLGSDVPFFLDPRPSAATSRGELLRPLDLRVPFAVLLVNPGIHIATPWAYRQVGRVGEREASDLRGILAEGIANPAVLRERLVNDFEPAAFAAHPVLPAIKERIYEMGAIFALMSGSGSTMYGLFDDRERAIRAQTAFPEHWSVVVDPIVSAEKRPAGRAQSSNITSGNL